MIDDSGPKRQSNSGGLAINNSEFVRNSATEGGKTILA